MNFGELGERAVGDNCVTLCFLEPNPQGWASQYKYIINNRIDHPKSYDGVSYQVQPRGCGE